MYYLIVWRSHVSNGWGRGCVPSGGSGGESVSLPFPPVTGCSLPWLTAPFSVFKARGVDLRMALWLSLASLLHLRGHLRLHWTQLGHRGFHLKFLNLIPSSKSLSPCKVTYLQVPKIRTRASLRRRYFSYHSWQGRLSASPKANRHCF